MGSYTELFTGSFKEGVFAFAIVFIFFCTVAFCLYLYI